MEIVQCLECAGNVSTRAETCPHCGYPAENYPSIAQSWGILGIMIAATVILIPTLMFFGPDPSSMSFRRSNSHSHTTGHRHSLLDHLSYKEEENEHRFIQSLD